MSSPTFAPYQHSGRFDLSNLVTVFFVAAAVAYPLGYVYAGLNHWITFVVLRGLVAFGYGFGFGKFGAWLLKCGRVRNEMAALLAGCCFALLALYCQWNAFIHLVVKEAAPPLLSPSALWLLMLDVLDEGTWSFRGVGNVSGILLGLVWLAEAGIIGCLSASVPFETISTTPYCETSRCWLDQQRKIDTLEAFTDPAQIAALKRADVGPLLQAKPRLPGSTNFARITLKHSPECKIFHTLRLDNITTTTDTEGKVNESATELLGDLVLPASMFELITKFENFGARAPASDGPPPPVPPPPAQA